MKIVYKIKLPKKSYLRIPKVFPRQIPFDLVSGERAGRAVQLSSF